MSRVRQLLFLAALGLGATGCRSVGPGDVQLPQKLDNRLVSNAQACVDRLNRDRARAQSAMSLSDVLVLLGASAGAAGSIAAAFLSKPRSRRVSALVGAVGALTAGAPKTLDDPADILTKRARAERHWVVGYKVLTQTMISYEPSMAKGSPQHVAQLTGDAARSALAASEQQRQKALLYVLDRFIDCTADQPPENFEELPSSGFLAVGEPVASNKSLESPETQPATDKPPALTVPQPGSTSRKASTALLYMESITPSDRKLPEAQERPEAQPPVPSPPSTSPIKP